KEARASKARHSKTTERRFEERECAKLCSRSSSQRKPIFLLPAQVFLKRPYPLALLPQALPPPRCLKAARWYHRLQVLRSPVGARLSSPKAGRCVISILS